MSNYPRMFNIIKNSFTPIPKRLNTRHYVYMNAQNGEILQNKLVFIHSELRLLMNSPRENQSIVNEITRPGNENTITTYINHLYLSSILTSTSVQD